MASSSSGCGLHQILRSLCLNTEWKYAVFWKLKHRARMVLTCEDAYYDNLDQHDPLANHCFPNTIESMHNGYHSREALGLALAKMSYHVYSLGEGIVGQVAVSGKHQWIFADKHANSYCSLFEFCYGWQSQFVAGIRTIVVVSVVPHGVVQLGSLNKVYEDVKLVSHIRNVFFALQESSVGHISSSIECSRKSLLFKQDFPTKLLDSEVIPLDKAVQKEWPDGLLPEFAYPQKYSDSSFVPLSSNHPKGETQVENKHEGLQLSTAASDSNLEHQNQLGRHLINNAVCKGETDGWKDSSSEPENVYANSPAVGSINLHNVPVQAEQYGAGHAYYSSNLLSSALSDMVKPSGLSSYPNEVLDISKSSDIKFQNNLKSRNQNDLVDMDSINTSFKFSAGCELYEVLGPAFLGKSIHADNQVDNTEAGANIEMQEGMSCSQLTFESGSENLLEAVVANVYHIGSDMKSGRSFCRSAPSSLTTGNTPEPSSVTKCTITSAGYSINKSSLVEDNKQNCLNSSELCGTMSSKAHSSTCLSNCEQLERSSEPAKNNKKRARPGENPRPRPRDRQLIQDRLKELRELVPNGAKCSIDSLLERTIKHMVFLQGITKHADKLGKCADSKMHQEGAGILGSSNYEQGSSWVVEVGSHLKVCSIVVENINKNGQMRVKLLCEECSHFLELAEVIRSLGLTILKGFTEAHGEKTWICFVVEGQNRVFHRMDILWSLVQVLQSKATS
ncbi:conserved peptide upstream open reading frame 7, LONESOME HIGHWAY LIKE 2 [Hibiscus trionum]|uniref:Conserved peptide upstream open reading frame 7, LONESOME HIGHWAY LIKE 2 n=1 Tax=Hibiscus trionum TaxID=183268 RepID=A0A9W7HAD4_HIBTR|nr:conserved peptide upstream open reading frame 7, LONESOME HIGHWAY LIKE 2 [Hibiscus trionum]